MYYKVEFDIETFHAWSGGLDTKQDILKANLSEEFNSYMEEAFSYTEDIPTDTEINDFLWFERDEIYQFLGLNEDGELEEEEEED